MPLIDDSKRHSYLLQEQLPSKAACNKRINILLQELAEAGFTTRKEALELYKNHFEIKSLNNLPRERFPEAERWLSQKIMITRQEKGQPFLF